jgi:(4-(4-[2-(gamma-L-glutamylamino)ethyl]phenoxymethyl)furan-2-yl)methanamine synthase
VITVAGWDVGGVAVKLTWLHTGSGVEPESRSTSRQFEIWRARERLPEIARAALSDVAAEPPDVMAVTMTAELSDVFATKREGVLFVFDALQDAFPACPIYALSLDGIFEPLKDAVAHPLDFAAANWLATASWLAGHYRDALLVDTGSTTTDIIPILGGRVAASGRTDLARLLAGELVYTGALRTHLAAIVQDVPVAGRPCPVAAEYFAVAGDVHLLLGNLAPSDYTCPTPDGRPASVEAARARLARLVCADTEQLDATQIEDIARYVNDRQCEQIGRGLRQVLGRLGGLQSLPVVAMGIGAFLARECARRLDLDVVDLAEDYGRDASLVAPSWAAACLLARDLEHAA